MAGHGPPTHSRPEVYTEEVMNTSREHSRAFATPGPLVVSTANPRYFTVASNDGKAVYLTGSHMWNNLHDGMGPRLGMLGHSGAARLR
jgi:hypothetical protein